MENSVVSFPIIKDGFMAKMRTLKRADGTKPYFNNAYQVTDDEAAVNRGAKYWIITRPGSAPITPQQTKKIYNVAWGIVFDMQIRYKSYKESWDEFGLMRDAILKLFVFTLDKTLPGVKGIWDITISAPDLPGYKPPNSPTWIGQQMTATITQQINVFK
jgi:hypothetical protein